MKFYVTPYHFNLLKDYERLAVFYEAIIDYYNKYSDLNENSIKLDKIAFDIGCGSGILSYFTSKYFNKVIAIDKDKKIADFAKKSFEVKNIGNINLILIDVLKYDFQEKADLIICEMLDTALIDEEEVPVLNKLHKYLKEDGEIIPQGIINIAEPIYMERDNIHYEDDFNDSKYKILGDSVKYSEFKFSKIIDIEFKTVIEFKIAIASKFNGIKITTFTKLNDNIICGPTHMMNPSMFIPIEEKIAKEGDNIKVSLEYIMGSGIETIKTKILN